jgi:hypothetical protein
MFGNARVGATLAVSRVFFGAIEDDLPFRP